MMCHYAHLLSLNSQAIFLFPTCSIYYNCNPELACSWMSWNRRVPNVAIISSVTGTQNLTIVHGSWGCAGHHYPLNFMTMLHKDSWGVKWTPSQSVRFFVICYNAASFGWWCLHGYHRYSWDRGLLIGVYVRNWGVHTSSQRLLHRYHTALKNAQWHAVKCVTLMSLSTNHAIKSLACHFWQTQPVHPSFLFFQSNNYQFWTVHYSPLE